MTNLDRIGRPVANLIQAVGDLAEHGVDHAGGRQNEPTDCWPGGWLRYVVNLGMASYT